MYAHTYACGCICVWRVGRACARLGVRRQGVQRVCMCVYCVPLVPRVVCTPPTICVTFCDSVYMWLWLVVRSPLPPAAALPPPALRLQGHSGTVTSVAWSPDGEQLASGSGDYTLRVWDAASGTCTATLRVGGRAGRSARQGRDAASSCASGVHEYGPLRLCYGVCMHTPSRARVGVCACGVWAGRVRARGYGVRVCNVCVCVCMACRWCRVSCAHPQPHV